MTAVQQPIQDRGGHHLVAGEHLRPILDRFVGRDEGAPPLVPVAHQPEEQTCLLARSFQRKTVPFLFGNDPPGRQFGLIRFIRIRKVAKLVKPSETANGSFFRRNLW